jgi:hypothetical protein
MTDDHTLNYYANNAGSIFIALEENEETLQELKAGKLRGSLNQQDILARQSKWVNSIDDDLLKHRVEFTQLILQSPKKKEIEATLAQYHLLRRGGLFRGQMTVEKALLVAWRDLRTFRNRNHDGKEAWQLTRNYEDAKKALRTVFATAIAAGATTKVPEHRVLVGK